MRGTVAGSLVSIYVYLQECVCVCLLDVCGQRNLDLNCSGEAFCLDLFIILKKTTWPLSAQTLKTETAFWSVCICVFGRTSPDV